MHVRMRRILGNGVICAVLSLTAAHAIAAEAGAAFDRTIYLVRHGAYVADPTAKPDVGPGLTPLGIAQARLIAARLRGMPLHFDSLTSSKMLRAIQTAAVVHESLPDVPTSSSALLSECTPPALVKLGNEPEAGLNACKEKLDSAFTQFFVPAKGAEKNDLLVCHGNVIRYLMAKALGVDSRTWFNMTLPHASMTVIRVRADGSFQVRAFADSGHIPPNLTSWGTDSDPQLVAP